MMKNKNVLVIGGGSWGTCLSKLLLENGHNVYLWEHNEKVREVIRNTKENPQFLTNIKLPDNLNVVDDYGEVLENPEKYGKIDILLLATPTQFLRTILKRLKKFLNYNIILVNVAKGLEIASKKRISEMVAEELEHKEYSYVLLAGPTHAEEVAQKLPSAILSVSENEKAAKTVQTTFSNLYYNANPKTFMGLSGLGDIIVTCTSKHSRNRYVGEKLGQGEKIEDIISHMNMVSEGAETIKALYKIIKENNLKAPIFTALYEVIYKGKPVSELESTFMSRDLKSEFLN